MLFIGYRWLDDRIAIRDVFDDVGSKYVPPHVNIFYCFGGLEERFCVWPSLGWYTDRLLHVSHVSGPIAGCMFTDGIELTPQLMLLVEAISETLVREHHLGSRSGHYQWKC